MPLTKESPKLGLEFQLLKKSQGQPRLQAPQSQQLRETDSIFFLLLR